MGTYPLFCCRDWSGLRDDLAELDDELVTVSLVADPFGGHTSAELDECFPDRVIPFKEHFVLELAAPNSTSRHHRRNATRALDEVDVETCVEPPSMLGDWTALYTNLIHRHAIGGIRAFSEQAFARQLRVPGLVAFRAVRGDRPIGMTLWYEQGDVAYYHLGAYSEVGYELGASFAVFWRAIEHFRARGMSWLNLGAGAGLGGGGEDGLARFKRGWSTATRTAYFCGAILAPRRYAAILEATTAGKTDYFPAYRDAEFAQ